MRRLASLWAFTFALVAPHVLAQIGKYQITEAEKAACTPDAERLCADAYPDEDKLLTCMKVNRASLSDECRTAFMAGLKRRHLH